MINIDDERYFRNYVDEEPYSIDRMLTHLRLAGKFDNVTGVIFGECQDCRERLQALEYNSLRVG